jgi:hypothetical protein
MGVMAHDLDALDSDALDTIEDAAAMVEGGVHDDAGGEGEGEEIGDSICGGRVEQREGLIDGEVEGVVLYGDRCDVVALGEAVVGLVRGSGRLYKLKRCESAWNGVDAHWQKCSQGLCPSSSCLARSHALARERLRNLSNTS